MVKSFFDIINDKVKIYNLEKRVTELEKVLGGTIHFQAKLATDFMTHVSNFTNFMNTMSGFINTANLKQKIDSKVYDQFLDSMVDLSDELTHLKGKVNYFTEDKERGE